MIVTAGVVGVERRLGMARWPWWISMLGVAAAGAVADAALKLWAVSRLAYLHETATFFGLNLLLVLNRRPSFDYQHLVIGPALVVMIKFLALGYLGWRLKGWWRWLGLGLILGGALANVGNWLLTHAVVDFLVMPWATVNLADLLIVAGAAVICAGWSGRVASHLLRRRCVAPSLLFTCRRRSVRKAGLSVLHERLEPAVDGMGLPGREGQGRRHAVQRVSVQ
jgi:lipoprotein signal peptidase